MSDVETSPVDSNPQLNEITSIYNTANPNVLYTALLASYFMVLSVNPFLFSFFPGVYDTNSTDPCLLLCFSSTQIFRSLNNHSSENVKTGLTDLEFLAGYVNVIVGRRTIIIWIALVNC